MAQTFLWSFYICPVFIHLLQTNINPPPQPLANPLPRPLRALVFSGLVFKVGMASSGPSLWGGPLHFHLLGLQGSFLFIVLALFFYFFIFLHCNLAIYTYLHWGFIFNKWTSTIRNVFICKVSFSLTRGCIIRKQCLQKQTFIHKTTCVDGGDVEPPW